MSATALRIAALGLAAAVTAIAFTSPAGSAADVRATGKVVFHSRLKGGNNEIFAMSPDGTGLTRLTRRVESDSMRSRPGPRTAAGSSSSASGSRRCSAASSRWPRPGAPPAS